MPWRPEFYGGELYWEAWFFSSGTLTVESGKSYIADAWGIGGGSSTPGAYSTGSAGGSTGMAEGITLSGSVAISIGAGANEGDTDGGTTKLGTLLTCKGGEYVYGDNTGSQAAVRYRFGDADKSGEAGAPYTSYGSINGGGWLHFQGVWDSGGTISYSGCGYGAGGGYELPGHAGALVVRIPI